MIGYLQGKVLKNNGKTLLLNVNGVGYEVTVPVDTATTFSPNTTAELFTYLHVREDDLSLYGFETEEKLQFYKLLLTVSGVGPKMGIELLSLPIHRLKQAIVEEDKSFLTSVKGLGDKLASRIALELKDKIKLDVTVESVPGRKVNIEVVEALERLGYDRNRVIKLLKNMTEPIEDEQELIKYGLRNL